MADNYFLDTDTAPTFLDGDDGNTILFTGENTAEAARQAGLATAAAELATGPTYTSVAAGEAATTAGQQFKVATGGALSVYERTGGGSTLLYTMPTIGALSATTGATLVGSNDGASGTLWTTVAGFIERFRSTFRQTNSQVNYNSSGPFWAFGDSFTVGQGATTAGQRYINRIAQKLDLSVTNYATSGRASFEATRKLFDIPTSASEAVNKTSGLVTWMASFNDVYRGGDGAKTLSKIGGELRSFLSSLFSAGVVVGNSVATTTGTWTTLPSGFAGNAMRAYRSFGGLGVQSVVNGSTLTETVSGDNVVIHTFATDGVVERCGSFTVSVDGTVLATYNGDGKTDGLTDGSYHNQITHDAVILTGLGSGSHTVVITAITDGVKPVYIDTIETMMPANVCCSVLVSEGAFQSDAGWALGGGIWSQSAMEAANNVINATVEEFSGYPIAVVRINDYFDTATGISDDNNHPNDIGHQQISAAFLAALRFNCLSFPSLKVTNSTSPTRFDIWNTYNDAGNRNWTFAGSQNTYGDLVLRVSTAKDGDPVAAGADVVSFTADQVKIRADVLVNNATSRVTNDASPTRLDLYNTFNSAGNRNWSIAQSYNSYGDVVFRVSTAKDGDPISAGSDVLSLQSTRIKANVELSPNADNTIPLGSSSLRWSDLHAAKMKMTPVAVASLTAAATAGAGAKAFVSDANATTFASIVAGGGSNKVPVYSDGTNWLIG